MKIHTSDVDWAFLIVVVVGAINWGLSGVLKYDLVHIVFGSSPVLARWVYGFIGVSGLYWLYKLVTLKK